MHPADQANSFSLVGSFQSAPHLYNYLHGLNFFSSGQVEMFDGAGQHVNAHVKGHFSVQARDQRTALVRFSDLVEVKLKPQLLAQTVDAAPVASDYSNIIFVENPDYHNEEPIRTLAPITVLVIREEGVFPFVKQTIWKIDHEEERPCLLYRARYVFEIDPLEPVRDRRAGWHYYQRQGWKEPDPRCYYCWDEVQELSYGALVQMGIFFS